MERGIDRRRDHPAIFARDRVELVAERDRNARPFALDDLADAPLMRGIDDRPQEADGDRLDAALLQVAHGLDHVGLAERRPLVAQRIDPAAHLAGPVARHEGLRIVDEHRVGPLARRLAQGQHVGVPGIADEADRRHLAFDQGVGRDRGAVDDQFHLGEKIAQAHAVVLGGEREAIDESPLELAGRRGRLEDLEPRVVGIEHEIAEGAADIHASKEHLSRPSHRKILVLPESLSARQAGQRHRGRKVRQARNRRPARPAGRSG